LGAQGICPEINAALLAMVPNTASAVPAKNSRRLMVMVSSHGTDQ
jgi:hypothetical protein